ncbi:N-acetylmuramoyl-L-alanine amidase [Sporosarcina sp. ANT_H38]|uniref:N-acetylmuramoyl-L-alanine amidase n=1 Tax=Sporosarcina sp. ANT_H38 TaxID=2597358 RepID=UPI0039829F6B
MFAHKTQEAVSLVTGIKLANSMNVDAFVSIHANVFDSDWNSANGIETLVYSAARKETMTIASLTQNALIAACNRVDRGVKKVNYAVLLETKMPAVHKAWAL